MEETSDRRTDDELMAIVDERFTWTVNGRQGRIHCLAWSLRAAVERAAAFEKSWPMVLEVRRQPSDSLIISAPQLHRLKKLVAALEPLKTEMDAEVAE